MVEIFGFSNLYDINKNECIFFFDSLFRGIMKVVLRKGEQTPLIKGICVSPSEIVTMVNTIYRGQVNLNKDDFIEYVSNQLYWQSREGALSIKFHE
jgi:hypothetical protein